MERSKLLYTLLTVANAGITVLCSELVARQVPIPVGWEWVGGIAVAMLTTLSTQLPRVEVPLLSRLAGPASQVGDGT